MKTKWQLPERLEGRALVVARVVWIVTSLVLVAVVAVGFARAYAQPMLLSILGLTELFAELNLGLRPMITFALVGPFVAVIIVSAVVFKRRSNDPMALLLTGALLMFYAYGTRSLIVYEGVPVLQYALPFTFVMSAVLLTLLLGLFPNGAFEPRWVVWLSPAAIFLLILVPGIGVDLMTALENGDSLTAIKRNVVYGYGVIWLFGVTAQVIRYRQKSTLVEKQQAKWAIAPMLLWISAIVVALTLSIASPATSSRLASWIILVSMPLNFLIPIALAIAILRYRLYEIDKIISRTFGYAIVVAVLGLIYFAGSVWLPSRVANGSPLFVAATTLAVAAVFNPLRRWVLRQVDKRFYRSRFDSEQITETFMAHLRNQTSVPDLPEYWVSVVAQTMHPSSIGVWLKEGSNRDRTSES